MGPPRFISITRNLGDPVWERIVAQMPIPAAAYYSISYTSLGLRFSFAVSMLGRRNWARYALIALVASEIGVQFATATASWVTVFGFVLLVLTSALLLRKPADAYFAADARPRREACQ